MVLCVIDACPFRVAGGDSDDYVIVVNVRQVNKQHWSSLRWRYLILQSWMIQIHIRLISEIILQFWKTYLVVQPWAGLWKAFRESQYYYEFVPWRRIIGSRLVLKCLKNLSQVNRCILSNARHSTSVFFTNKEREYWRGKCNVLWVNRKNKNNGDFCRGLNWFKNGFQHGTSLVKDESSDPLVDFHSILKRWKNHFCC